MGFPPVILVNLHYAGQNRRTKLNQPVNGFQRSNDIDNRVSVVRGLPGRPRTRKSASKVAGMARAISGPIAGRHQDAVAPSRTTADKSAVLAATTGRPADIASSATFAPPTGWGLLPDQRPEKGRHVRHRESGREPQRESMCVRFHSLAARTIADHRQAKIIVGVAQELECPHS